MYRMALALAVTIACLWLAGEVPVPAASAQAPEPSAAAESCEIKPKAKCAKADLRKWKLKKVDLREADLREADLREADLSEADLTGADLSGAQLQAASLRGAKLRNANLGGATLRASQIRDSDLQGAILTGNDLRWADLSGADLTGANLSGALRCGAIGPDGQRNLDDCTRAPGRASFSGAAAATASLTAQTTLVTISGEVVDQYGQPIVNALLFASPRGNTASAATTCPTGVGGRGYTNPGTPPGPSGLSSYSTFSDANGRFSFQVTSGDWSLAVTKANLFSGTGAVMDLSVYDVPVTGLRLTLLNPTGAITGVVRASNGQPLTAGAVIARDELHGFFRSAPIGGDGRFAIPVVTGIWSVTALPPATGDHGLRTGTRGILVGPETAEAIANLNLQAATANLRGQVRASDGQPLINSVISAEWTDPNGGGRFATGVTQVDGSGVYTVPVTSGAWTMLAASLESITETLPLLSTASVAPGQAVTVKDVVLPEATHCLTGRLLDHAGAPALNALLSASMTPLDAPADTILSFGGPDALGVYETPLTSGAWTLNVAELGPGERTPRQISTVHNVPNDPLQRDFQLLAAFRLFLPGVARLNQGGW